MLTRLVRWLVEAAMHLYLAELEHLRIGLGDAFHAHCEVVDRHLAPHGSPSRPPAGASESVENEEGNGVGENN
eukprot:PDM62990.1 hypothetical protein PRIPAC_50205 [Pristionchus pacificus]